jgi:hypothetical protein
MPDRRLRMLNDSAFNSSGSSLFEISKAFELRQQLLHNIGCRVEE